MRTQAALPLVLGEGAAKRRMRVCPRYSVRGGSRRRSGPGVAAALLP